VNGRTLIGAILALIAVGIVYWAWPEDDAVHPHTSELSVDPRPDEREQRVPTIQRWERSSTETHDGFSGRITATNGRALTASVCVTSEPTRGDDVPCVNTNAAGEYELHLTSGFVYTVSASAPGHIASSRRVVASAPALDFVLEAGGNLIRGIVLDATGGTIAGALVSAAAGGMSPLGRTLSDTEGRFELRAAAAMVDLTATAPGYALAQLELVSPADDVHLVMAPGAVLTGRVLHADTKHGVAGASVTIRARDGVLARIPPAATGDDGRFRVTGVPAGAYELTATADQLISQPQFARVAVASESPAIVLELAPAARVEANLMVGDEPCQHGTVNLVGAASVAADVEEGTAVLPAVRGGRYNVQAYCERGGFARYELDVPQRGLVHPVWRMDPSFELKGRVATTSGTGVAGVSVQCMPTGSAAATPPPVPPCTTGADGDFACHGFHAGRYRCAAELTKPESAIDVELPTDDVVTLVLEPRATIRVDLGAAVAGATIVATDEAGIRRYARSAGGAWFAFHNLPLGVYEVGTGQTPNQASVNLTTAGQVAEVALRPELGLLSGQVLDAAGMPVVEAWVQVQPQSDGAAAVPPALTDDDGQFEFRSIAVGIYSAMVTSPLGEASLTDFETGTPRVLTLRGYGSVGGSVVDTDGNPVSEFVVSYADQEKMEVQRVSDAQGRWSLPWLKAGNWKISVRGDAGSAEQSVKIQPATRAELHFTLSSLGGTQNDQEPTVDSDTTSGEEAEARGG